MTVTRPSRAEPGPFDLVLERRVPVPPALVWRCWTEPEHLVRWFTPAPWTTVEAVIDPRPGGVFRTVMRGPDGSEHAGTGVVLEAVPERRFVWTDCLTPGWRPAALPFFTAIIELEPDGDGTIYRATALHRDDADRAKHAAMGFHDGWGKALDQLVAHARTLRAEPR